MACGDVSGPLKGAGRRTSKAAEREGVHSRARPNRGTGPGSAVTVADAETSPAVHKRKGAVRGQGFFRILPVYLYPREATAFPGPRWMPSLSVSIGTAPITPGLRRRIENGVELMLAFLDALDAATVEVVTILGGASSCWPPTSRSRQLSSYSASGPADEQTDAKVVPFPRPAAGRADRARAGCINGQRHAGGGGA